MSEDLLALLVLEEKADFFRSVVAVHGDQTVVIKPEESIR